MKPLTFLIACWMLPGLPLTAQQPTIKKSLQGDLAQTYSFVEAQKMTLSQLASRFPDLAYSAASSEVKWNASFGRAGVATGDRLASLLGDEWPKLKETMMAQYAPLISKQNETASREYALQFFEEVNKRAGGQLSSPVREMLLASHPDYRVAPEQEFARGWVSEFNSAGHSKAKGLEVKLKVPISWVRAEADRPNIVQKWRSDGGHGDDQMMFQIRLLPDGLSAADRSELFTEAAAIEMAGEGGKLISFKAGKLERLPLGIFHSIVTTERIDVKTTMRNLMYYVVTERHLIMMQFLVISEKGEDFMEQRMKTIEPLTKLIAGSMVLPALYK